MLHKTTLTTAWTHPTRGGIDRYRFFPSCPINCSSVDKRLLSYLTSSGLMSSLQSAYRVHLSTETAVLRVIADILQALDHGDFAALTLLMDLSAAFDTVGHATLLRRLQLSYGIRGMALSWLRSYLSDRTQFVRSGSTSLRPALLRYGVSQGTVLGPILFYCIQLTLSVSSPCMGCAPIYMLTTPSIRLLLTEQVW